MFILVGFLNSTGLIPSESCTQSRAVSRLIRVCLGFNLLAEKIPNLNAWKIGVANLILQEKSSVPQPASGKVQAFSF